jgi:hypothetical protein
MAAKGFSGCNSTRCPEHRIRRNTKSRYKPPEPLPGIGFPARLAASIVPHDPDTTLIDTQGSFLPGVVSGFDHNHRFVTLVCSLIGHRGRIINIFYTVIGPIRTGHSGRFFWVVGQTALLATAVGADNADAAAITAQPALFPFAVR